jgi:antitoxin ParD1/3/4
MSKNTSILLGDHFDHFIQQQVGSGRYSSASEVVRTALRLMENEEQKRNALIEALKSGEESGFVENFDQNDFMNGLRKKHATGGL